MKKTLIAITAAALVTIGGSAYSGSINHHGVDMLELVTIQSQMAELDKKLSYEPNNPTLRLALEQQEKDLVVKLRKYNQLIAEINKRKAAALTTMPAAGTSTK